LVNAYETEPDNFPMIVELMQDLQRTGHPPKEIVHELAPGLEIGDDGMPVLPNMGAGIPGGPPMPGGAPCTIA
jgi:peroxin-19